jgi:HK97 family phage prohead protease
MNEKEVRYFKSPVTFREEGDEGGEIEGVAAIVNKRADLGWYDEMIMPGAFDDVLRDDVRALMNHDSNRILARTSSGTLTIGLNDNGDLTYRYKTPNRSYAKDLEDAIKTGDVDQSSFAFRVKEEAWEYSEDNSNDLRKIVKVERLYDVSPVTFPAYQDTSVAKRSWEQSKPEQVPDHYHEEKERELKLKKAAL